MLKKIVYGVLMTGAFSLAADYISDWREAVRLEASGKKAEAEKLFIKISKDAINDQQQAAVLYRAAMIELRNNKNYDKAVKLAKEIRSKPHATTAQMEIMLNSGHSAELIQLFKDEDILTYPENCAGKAFLYRGEAYSIMKDGRAAEEDLRLAVENILDKKLLVEANFKRGRNFHENLKDDKKSLESYKAAIGDGKYFDWCVGESMVSSVQLLIDGKNYDEAIKMLSLLDIDKYTGYWGAALLSAKAKLLTAQGKTTEAKEIYRRAASLPGISTAQKQKLEKALENL